MEREGIVGKTGGYDPPDPGDFMAIHLRNMATYLRDIEEADMKWDMEIKKSKKILDVIISNMDLFRAKLATEAKSQAYLADIKNLNQGNKAYFARLEPRVNMDIITGKITILPNQVVEQSVQLKAQNVQLPTQGADQVKLTDGVRSVLSCVENIPKFQQEPANLSVLDPNSNPYEPMFNPSVVEGEGVRLGSSSKMDSNLSSLEKGGVMTEIRNMKFADSNPKVCNVQLSTDGKKEDFIIGMKDNVFTLLNTGSLNNVKVGCGSSYEPLDPGDKVSKYTPNVNGKKDNVFTLLNTGGVNGVKVRCGSSYEPPDPGDKASRYTPNVTNGKKDNVFTLLNTGSLNNVKVGFGSSYEPPDPGDKAGKGDASLYDSPDPLISRPKDGFLSINNVSKGVEIDLSCVTTKGFCCNNAGEIELKKGVVSLDNCHQILSMNGLGYDRDKGVISLDKKIGLDYDRDKGVISLDKKISMDYDRDKGVISLDKKIGVDYDRDKGVISLDKKIGLDYDREKGVISLDKKIGLDYDRDKGVISLDKKICLDYDRDRGEISLDKKIGMDYDFYICVRNFGLSLSSKKYLEYIDDFPPKCISFKGGG